MLKLSLVFTLNGVLWQPPSGGCVLKHPLLLLLDQENGQPPSGGCVLKLVFLKLFFRLNMAAAFGRLCVET